MAAFEGNLAISRPVEAANPDLSIAVLLPSYNEATAIATVISDFRRALPDARIYVYDNNSADDTALIARTAGAIVRSEPRQGKGFVMRRMFADIDADIYVLCDADDTYDASAAPQLVAQLVENGLDMVVGTRAAISASAYRPAHAFGNRLLSGLVRQIFGEGFNDMLSGYRVLSNRFVKSFPAMSSGFETETELTIHALELEMPSAEVATCFKDRAPGSESKLRTFADGWRILWTIMTLLRQERPLQLFGAAAAVLAALSVYLSLPVFITYFQTGLVPRIPTAVLSMGLMLLAMLSLFSGLILDSVTRGRCEMKRLRYLQYPGIHAAADSA